MLLFKDRSFHSKNPTVHGSENSYYGDKADIKDPYTKYVEISDYLYLQIILFLN